MDSPNFRHQSSLIRSAALVRESLSEIARILQQLDRQRCERFGVSVSQSHALLLLLEEGPMTVGTLGERLCLEKSTASRLAKGLLKNGHLRKRSPSSDERKVILQVTESGMRLARRIFNDLSEEYVDLLLTLGSETRNQLPLALESLHLGLRHRLEV